MRETKNARDACRLQWTTETSMRWPFAVPLNPIAALARVTVTVISPAHVSSRGAGARPRTERQPHGTATETLCPSPDFAQRAASRLLVVSTIAQRW